jgi:hypothetical protein
MAGEGERVAALREILEGPRCPILSADGTVSTEAVARVARLSSGPLAGIKDVEIPYLVRKLGADVAQLTDCDRALVVTSRMHQTHDAAVQEYVARIAMLEQQMFAQQAMLNEASSRVAILQISNTALAAQVESSRPVVVPVAKEPHNLAKMREVLNAKHKMLKAELDVCAAERKTNQSERETLSRERARIAEERRTMGKTLETMRRRAQDAERARADACKTAREATQMLGETAPTLTLFRKCIEKARGEIVAMRNMCQEQVRSIERRLDPLLKTPVASQQVLDDKDMRAKELEKKLAALKKAYASLKEKHSDLRRESGQTRDRLNTLEKTSEKAIRSLERTSEKSIRTIRETSEEKIRTLETNISVRDERIKVLTAKSPMTTYTLSRGVEQSLSFDQLRMMMNHTKCTTFVSATKEHKDALTYIDKLKAYGILNTVLPPNPLGGYTLMWTIAASWLASRVPTRSSPTLTATRARRLRWRCSGDCLALPSALREITAQTRPLSAAATTLPRRALASRKTSSPRVRLSATRPTRTWLRPLSTFSARTRASTATFCAQSATRRALPRTEPFKWTS